MKIKKNQTEMKTKWTGKKNKQKKINEKTKQKYAKLR